MKSFYWASFLVAVWSQVAVMEFNIDYEYLYEGEDMLLESLTFSGDDSASGSGDTLPGKIVKHFDDLKSLNNFISQKYQGSLQPISVTGIVNITDRVVGNSEWGSLEPDTKHNVASKLLQAVAGSIMAAALSAPDGTLMASSESLDLEVRVHRGNISENERLRLNVKGNKMELYWRTVAGGNHSGVAAVGFIAYNNLESILDGDFVHEGGKLKTMGQSYRLNSDVVTIVAGAGHRMELSEPINFTLRHKEERNSNKIPVCVSWENAKERSFWSPRGCTVITSTGSHTTCACFHLASFAVLMAPFAMEGGFALHVITLVGVSSSLVCLAISIITFAFCRTIQSETRAIHVNLCLSLFLAQFLFLTGFSRTSNKVVCAVIAGFLHYFFLVAFEWMFLEGLHLYFIVRDISKVKGPRTSTIGNIRLYAFGYGLPGAIVGISAAINPSGFGTSRHCWLQLERGFIWSFLGPVCFIILLNTVLLTAILWILQKQLSSLNSEVSKIKDRRMLVFKATAQMFILGCTWILGFFLFQEETVAMAYLFTIVNSFQGTFIFIILCALNKQVRKEYRKCFGRMKKPILWTESANTNVASTAMSGETSVMESKL
ncbi:adhesion G protein-coupled receptor E1-like isoform X2 [Heptranchias perlo]|uniref:adhesion G protein-coupled receptor E1-like isoform X2 n=1 Tax=Heptranchias perlo TaxID=212740 RepID=UPI00355AB128